MTSVMVAAEDLAALTDSALSILWCGEDDPAKCVHPEPNDMTASEEELDYAKCCARCCAPCSAIMRMADAGTLEAALGERGPQNSYWDDENNCVNRAWLDAHVTRVCYMVLGDGRRVPCTEDIPDEE